MTVIARTTLIAPALRSPSAAVDVPRGSTSWWHRSRPSRVALMLGILWTLSLADLIFTLWAHFWTPFVEANPLAEQLLSSGKYCSVILLKLVTTAIGSVIFWRLRHLARGETGLFIATIAFFYLTYLWANYTQRAVSDRFWVEVALKTAPALQIH